MKRLQEMRKKKYLWEILSVFPVVFGIACIPLIMRVKSYDPQLSMYEWFPDIPGRMDVFLFYKNYAMTILAAVLALLLLYLYLRHSLRAEWIFVFLALYAALILISSLRTISEYHTWNGFLDMFESAFTLLGYCLVCYFSYTVIHTERQVRFIFALFFLSFGVLGILGISQFTGADFFAVDAVRDLLFPASLKVFQNSYGTELGDGIVYLTFFNPNYVGVYSCILIPLLWVLTFTARSRRWLFLYAAAAVLSVVSMVGSGSKTAVLALFPCILFLLLYFGKRSWKRILPVLAGYLLLFAGLNVLQSSSVFENALDRLMTAPTAYQEYALKDITLNDEDYTIDYNDRTVTVYYENIREGSPVPVVTDENGLNLALKRVTEDDRVSYQLAAHAFAGLSFVKNTDADGNEGFSVTASGSSFFVFYDEGKQTYLYTNYYGKQTKIQTAETCDLPLFHLMDGFSGRGYIWSKTLPLLKQTLLIGTGPDTFALVFPQEDYVSLVENGWEKILITKPHCMYLQIAVQTGVLSLVVFLIFYLTYFIQSFRLYRKRELLTLKARVGAAIFLSSTGFITASLVNDSTTGVSVVFWGLLGIGLACNRMVRESITQI